MLSFQLSTDAVPAVTIETERLVLRPFRESDLDVYAGFCSDIEMMRFIGGKTLSRCDSWRRIARMLGHWQLRGYGPWAVETREGADLVGTIGFNDPEGWPGFELGWTLGRPYWGLGYATEGARAALDFAFTEMGRDHVISLIHPENHASIRVAERIGETHERDVELLGQRVGVYGIGSPR